MIRSLPLVALLGLAWIAGCANPDENPFARCNVEDGRGCIVGERCYRGFCIPDGVDAGMMDAPMTPDAGTDSPVPVDVGSDTGGGCPGAGSDCPTSMPGPCAAGTVVCSGDGGAGVCVRDVDPMPETCNDVDDDCNGFTDDEADQECYAPSTTGCTYDTGTRTWSCFGICRTGTQLCDGSGGLGLCEGFVVPRSGPDGCTPPELSAVDDDCDGMIDEDCACTNGTTQDCYAGPDGTAGEGVCMAGTLTCTGGTFGDCVGEILPGVESCDNPTFDNDCNGVMDDVEGTGMPCETGEPGFCADGLTACMGTTIGCDAPDPMAERCNMLDDNCDGVVDDGFDLDASEDHCGMCGNSCGAGRTCCGGTCVSTDSDPTHCGDCPTTCSGSEASCCRGECHTATAPECTGCTRDCTTTGEICCAGTCVDPMDDVANCGGCGAMDVDFVCGAGERCCGGSCEGDSDLHCGSCDACTGTDRCCDDATGAADCVVDNDPMNCQACGVRCAASQACCGSGCSNLLVDELNCGMCGRACTASQVCSNGLCCPTGTVNSNGICCAPGLTGCGGACVNTLTSNAHCGRCGMACPVLTACCRGGCATLCL